MASLIPGWTASAGAAQPLRCARVQPADQRLALGLLLTGKPNERSGAVQQFVDYARAQQLDLTELWGGWEGDRLRAAMLIVPGSGRTGMAFISPAPSADADAALTQLGRAVIAGQDPQRVRLVQALLEPNQLGERRSLLAAGFTDLATLDYMYRPADMPQRALDLTHRGIHFVHWDETHRPLFARAILASYEQTRDCPGLLGLRDIDDIIAGHMATGSFDPQLWYAFYDGDHPVGVMLLSRLPSHHSGELVYLGIAPPYRGKALAQPILEHGLGELSQQGFSRILLAVDEGNAPALRLYRHLGFRVSARKVALIRPTEQPDCR